MALALNSESTQLVREASKYTYDWNITEFPKSYGNHESPEFSAGSNYQNETCQWRLRLDEDVYTECISLYIDERTKIQFSFLDNAEMYVIVSIVTKNGDEINQQEKQVVFAPHQTGVCFTSFVQENVLFDPKNKLVVNGKWTIRCRLYFFPKGTCSNTKINPNECKTIHAIAFDNFDKLLESKDHSDVKLVVQGEEFDVHKCVLAAHSRVFAAMFKHDMRERKENIVKIEDVKAEVMREMLRFVYASKVENVERMVEDLLAAADKYEIEALKVLCGNVYIKKLNVDNIHELLKLANTYGVSNLKTQALKFMLIDPNCANRKTVKVKGAESASFSLLEFVDALHEFKNQ